MNPVKTVNTVWAGRTGFLLDLPLLKFILSSHKLVDSIEMQCATTIKQLKLNIKGGGVVLLFKSGAFRIMGNLDDMTANMILCELLNEFCWQIPEIHLQTITLVSHNDININLNKLSNLIHPSHKRVYEPELFHALQIFLFSPIHVNIFSSGSIVLLGVKDIDKAQCIVDQLTPHIIESIYPKN